MNKAKRNFKGVWIPKEVWLNKDLTVMEKLFLVEIDSLDNEKGCFASNAHFSDFFGVSKGRCTQILKSLERKKYVKIKVIRDGKVISKRVIRILNTLFNKLNTPIEKTKYPYLENDEGNNTITNNTNREIRPLDFLKLNFPSRFEEEFLMKYKSEIKDFKKFEADFNDKVDFEGVEYSAKLFYRLSSYTRNWVSNQSKYQGKEEDDTGIRRLAQFKKIG